MTPNDVMSPGDLGHKIDLAAWVHVLGQGKETRENPPRHGENRKTPHTWCWWELHIPNPGEV